MLEDMAYRRGIGADLAEGVKRMSEKYGGKEYAMHAKGLEMAAYEPRSSVGHGLGYATGARGGCHISGGYMVYLEAVGPVNADPLSPKSKAPLTVFMQDSLGGVACAVTCIFTSYAMFPGLLSKIKPHGVLSKIISSTMLHSGGIVGLMLSAARNKMLPIKFYAYEKMLSAVTGERFSLGRLIRMGEVAANIERIYNIREGFTTSDDTLPDRLLKEPSVEGQSNTVVPLKEMLPRYYKARGWDKNGVPKPGLLKKLGIDSTPNHANYPHYTVAEHEGDNT